MNMAPEIVGMDPGAWREFLAAVSAQKSNGRMASGVPEAPGVAVIPIVGTLLPAVPDYFAKYGIAATAYSSIIDGVNAALDNPAITEILLWVDTPGGVVTGVEAAAQAIADAAKLKPVTAQINGLCASAGYWVTCGASKILATSTSLIGSIGVYKAFYDMTGANEQMGIKPVVIRDGASKGMGIDAITPEQIAAEQDNVNGIGDLFRTAVERGRNLNSAMVENLSTGRTWVAGKAAQLNLIDGVGVWAATAGPDTGFAGETSKTGAGTVANAKEKHMDEKEIQALKDEAAATATAAERARCVAMFGTFGEKDNAFALAQIEAGATETDALAAWGRKALAAPVVTPAAVAGTPPAVGVAPLSAPPAAAVTIPGEAPQITDFSAKVEALVAEEKITRAQAFARVQKEDPAGFEAWIQATQPK